MIKTLQPRIARLPMRKTVTGLLGRAGKRADRFYLSPEWRALRNEIIKRRGWRCEDPMCETPRGPWKQIYGDHVVELGDGGAPLDPNNVLLRCGACHGRKTAQAKATRIEIEALRGRGIKS